MPIYKEITIVLTRQLGGGTLNKRGNDLKSCQEARGFMRHRKKRNSDLKRMKEKELRIFIIMCSKESQVSRSLAHNKYVDKLLFKKLVVEYCVKLIHDIDKRIITTERIRDAMSQICQQSKCSFGQAQKVINVVLKQYCFLTNASDSIIKKIDCPLDSITMQKKGSLNKLPHKKYVEFQNTFQQEHNGLKVIEDLKYDEQRIDNYYK